MESIGLQLDPGRLTALHSDLTAQVSSLFTEIQGMVPEHLKPLTGNWKTSPKNVEGVFAKTVKKLVPCCTDCGEEDVTPTHEKKCIERSPHDNEALR